MSQSKTNSQKIKKTYDDLFSRIESLSPKGQDFILGIMDKLAEQAAMLAQNPESLSESNDSKAFFEEREIKKIGYGVEFFVLHGLRSTNAVTEAELTTRDALFKAQALFRITSLVGNVFIGGHHKLETEEMMNALNEVGQIGSALVGSALITFENFGDLLESSEASNG